MLGDLMEDITLDLQTSVDCLQQGIVTSGNGHQRGDRGLDDAGQLLEQLKLWSKTQGVQINS